MNDFQDKITALVVRPGDTLVLIPPATVTTAEFNDFVMGFRDFIEKQQFSVLILPNTVEASVESEVMP